MSPPNLQPLFLCSLCTNKYFITVRFHFVISTWCSCSNAYVSIVLSVLSVSTLQDVWVSLCTGLYTPGSQLADFRPGWDESCHHEAITLSCIEVGHFCHSGGSYDVSLTGKKRNWKQFDLTYHLYLAYRHSFEVWLAHLSVPEWSH